MSDLLAVPRPTLYRYLKEYPIPYARRAGRIQIPEDALDGIRKARELHDEGLGTEAVRRRLRGDESSLEGRLDRISETLEELRGDGAGHRSEVLALAPTDVRTLLARQTLLISAVFEMSRMLEELLASTGRPRQTTFEDALRSNAPGAAELPDPDSPATAIVHSHHPNVPESGRGGTFGTLSQRRRRLVLAGLIVAGLLVALLLAALLLA